MSKISIIISTGNSQADRIFAGVFGTTSEQGVFEVAPELKEIHLFSMLTPEALAAQGIDLTDNLATIEVAEGNVPAVKATILAGLRDHWLATYDQASVPAGFARAALQAERESVNMAVSKALAKLDLPTNELSLKRTFENINGNPVYGDMEFDEDDTCVGQSMSAGDVLSKPGVWEVMVVDGLDTSSLPSTVDTSSMNSYLSGSVLTSMTVFGAQDQCEAVLDAIVQLPSSVRNYFPLASNARFAATDWHQQRREQAQVTQIFVPGDAAQAATAFLVDAGQTATATTLVGVDQATGECQAPGCPTCGRGLEAPLNEEVDAQQDNGPAPSA